MCIMEEFVNALEKRVSQLRDDGHSMEAIAGMAGVTRAYLYRILDGTHAPTMERAQTIGDGVGLSLKLTVKQVV